MERGKPMQMLEIFMGISIRDVFGHRERTENGRAPYALQREYMYDMATDSASKDTSNLSSRPQIEVDKLSL